MAARPLLAVRADGGPGVGVGHVARGLALAEEWVRLGGAAVLVTAGVPEPWPERAAAAGVGVAAPGTDLGPVAWWGADGYALPPSDRRHGDAPVLVVDDHDTAGTGGAGAAVVVDQNLGAEAARYPHAGEVLAGPRYALLRSDVLHVDGAAPTPTPRPLVVVALGGAPTPEVRALAAAVADDPALRHADVEVLDGRRSAATAFVGATVVVAAAGSTTWELCFLGVPAVLTAVAANQEPLVERVSAAGAAVAAPLDAAAIAAAAAALLGDPERRAALAGAGRGLVDGWGSRRVAMRLRAGLLTLRAAEPADSEVVHRWNGDPAARAVSRNPEPIPWEDHVRWYAAQLADPAAAIYVAADPDGADVGVVRFALDGGRAEVSVAVAPERRGQHWGAALVVAGCRRLASDRGPMVVDAVVGVGNEASRRTFLAGDFDPVGGGADGWLRYVRTVDGGTDA